MRAREGFFGASGGQQGRDGCRGGGGEGGRGHPGRHRGPDLEPQGRPAARGAADLRHHSQRMGNGEELEHSNLRWPRQGPVQTKHYRDLQLRGSGSLGQVRGGLARAGELLHGGVRPLHPHHLLVPGLQEAEKARAAVQLQPGRVLFVQRLQCRDFRLRRHLEAPPPCQAGPRGPVGRRGDREAWIRDCHCHCKLPHGLREEISGRDGASHLHPRVPREQCLPELPEEEDCSDQVQPRALQLVGEARVCGVF
mmetsp:Transcript_5719/g.20565  ORF Transcript_5719/g.20565 Transcript_5719/m.20565 type:complete len:252 (-) Transcript_5719:489-1244(-)